jgi:hypothetical protein
MNLNKNDGSILKFLTLEPVVTPPSAPTYYTYGAIYYEEKEAIDSKGYYYVSFVTSTNTGMHIVKIDASTLKSEWNIFYKDTTTKQAPRFLFPDPADNTQLYLMGQRDTTGLIMKL